MQTGEAILAGGALLAAAVAAAALAARVGVPALLLFLGIGMAVGSDGTGWIAFDDYHLAREIGTVALAIILFEGGLAAGWKTVRPVLGPAGALAVAGTALTALLGGLAAHVLLGLALLPSLLLGAVLASTDGAAVFALLRDSPLPARLTATLEGEAGLNDPVAVVLVLGLIDAVLKPAYDAGDFFVLLLQELGLGLVAGLAVGAVGARVVPRLRLEPAGLNPVAVLAVGALAFGVADVLGGSGFLAVYLAALTLAGAPLPARNSVLAFHEGLAWLAQVALFLALGLLVFPSHLGAVALKAGALAFVLALVARPLATFVATTGAGFRTGERALLGWAGLRGAVPVVLATFPVVRGVPGSRAFFDIVFFVVLVSALLQGTTFEWVARRLRVAEE